MFLFGTFYVVVGVSRIFEGDILGFLWGLSLFVGLALNITIPPWTPRWFSWIVPLLTVVPFLGMLLIGTTPDFLFGLWFFYPWALGISLIHMANLIATHETQGRSTRAQNQ